MLTDEDLKTVRDYLGVPDLAPEKALSFLLDTHKTARDSIKPAHDESATLKVDLRRAQDELKAERAKNLDFSRNTAPKLDSEVAHERRLRITEKVKGLRGSPDWTSRAVTYLCGTAEAPNALFLSREAGADDVKAIDVLGLIADYKPLPKGGEDTGPQVIDFDRKEPDAKPDPKKVDAAALQEARAAYGLPTK